jgi:hypothetical protein
MAAERKEERRLGLGVLNEFLKSGDEAGVRSFLADLDNDADRLIAVTWKYEIPLGFENASEMANGGMGYTPCTPIWQAVGSDSAGCVLALLENWASADEEGWTDGEDVNPISLLVAAVADNKYNAVVALIERLPMEKRCFEDEENGCLVDVALDHGHEEMAWKLIRLGDGDKEYVKADHVAFCEQEKDKMVAEDQEAKDQEAAQPQKKKSKKNEEE